MRKIFIILFLTIDSIVSATTYYVSTTGNNSNDGLTISTPWATLAWAESHATTAGDVIALKKGDIWLIDNVLDINSGGISGNPIIWDGSLWGTGANAIIKANSDGGGSPKWNSLTHIAGCQYVTMQNITFDENNKFRSSVVAIGGAPGDEGPTPQNNEAYITIQDCSIINNGDGLGGYNCGIFIRTWNTNMSNITIQRNTVDGANNHTIVVYPGRTDLPGCLAPYETSNVYIGYNTCTNMGKNDDGTYCGIGIFNKVTGAIIEHNTITEGSGHGPGIAISSNEPILGWFPTGVIVRYNDVRMTKPCLYIERGQAKTVTAYYNKFYSTGSPSMGVIQVEEYASPDYTGAVFNFYNNTLVTAGSSMAGFKEKVNIAGICTFRNNIIINTSTSGYGCMVLGIATSTIHSNNAYYRSGAGDLMYHLIMTPYTGIYRSGAAAWEATCKITDPLLADLVGFNWHLLAGSPAIGKGISIAGLTQDIEGAALGNPPNIGCYETLGGPPVPVYSSSVVENATPTLVEITYNLSLANIVSATSAFNVQVNSVTRVINSVAIVGGKVQLTLANAIVYGDIITVAYTRPSVNLLQSVSGGTAASLSAQSVTNNSISVSPIYISSVVENAAPAILEMTYNLSLANIVPATSVFNVQVNSVARTVNSVSIVGGKVQLTLASAIVYGDIITVAYTKPSVNPLQSSSGGTAVGISAQPVTNNCISASPTYQSSVVENATPSILEMTYSLSLANIVPATSAFNVQVNSVSRTVNSVAIVSGKVQLTLASAIAYGDVVTVAYIKPGSNFLQTSSGGAAVSISAQPVTNNCISVPPIYISSVVENATPAMLEMTYNLSLANIVPAPSAFNVQVNSASRTVNSAAIVGGKVQLTLASAIVYGDVITVAYTKPGSNFLQTSSGGSAVSINAQPVTNNCILAFPSYISSVIEDASPNILEMTYNLNLTNILPGTSTFNVQINSIRRNVNSVTISGNKVQLTLAGAAVNGDIVTISYTKPATNPLQTALGGEAASIIAQPVTNKCLSVAYIIDPVYLSSAIEDATPAILEMIYDLSLADIVPATSAFIVQVNSVSRTINSVAIVGGKVQLTLTNAVVYNDIVTVSYSKPATNPLQTASGGQAASITAQSVTNNINDVSSINNPIYISSLVEDATPALLEMTFDKDLNDLVTPIASAFNVKVNSSSIPVNSITIAGSKVRLTLASLIVYGDIVTVAYTKPATNPLQTISGGEAASISAQSVINNVKEVIVIIDPVYLTSVIQNATPAILEMTYSISLANIVPATSAFNVQVNSVSRTVIAVAIIGGKVQLILANPVMYGDIVTVTYTKPATNPLQTALGGEAASISAQPVTNNIVLTLNNSAPVIVVDYKTNSYSGFVGEIDAIKSYDIDNDPLTFEWTSPADVDVSSLYDRKIQFLAPVVQESEIINFSLKVSDGATSQTQTIPINILPYKPELQIAKISNIEASSYEKPYYPNLIADNNLESKWLANGDNQWVIFELEKPFRVSHVDITFLSGQRRFSYFDIYASNDTLLWEPILSNAASCSFSGNLQVFDFPEVKAETEYSYVKLVGQGNSEDTWNAFSEFKIFGTEHAEEVNITIHPNPAHEYFDISIEYPSNVTIKDAPILSYTIRIFSISGVLVSETPLESGILNVHYPINLNPGIYIVQMISNNLIVAAQKLIVN
jgi:uncharacterized repeat protein (TIGR02059 family)